MGDFERFNVDSVSLSLIFNAAISACIELITRSYSVAFFFNLQKIRENLQIHLLLLFFVFKLFFSELLFPKIKITAYFFSMLAVFSLRRLFY